MGTTTIVFFFQLQVESVHHLWPGKRFYTLPLNTACASVLNEEADVIYLVE